MEKRRFLKDRQLLTNSASREPVVAGVLFQISSFSFKYFVLFMSNVIHTVLPVYQSLYSVVALLLREVLNEVVLIAHQAVCYQSS
jgi:hypothetical protein